LQKDDYNTTDYKYQLGCGVAKLHSFADFGLRVSLSDLQMCAMWVGFSF
jgi:hypothetical protein